VEWCKPAIEPGWMELKKSVQGRISMWFEARYYSREQIDEIIAEYEARFPGGMDEFCVMLEDGTPDHKRKFGVYDVRQ
jgi:hypothetical protein